MKSLKFKIVVVLFLVFLLAGFYSLRPKKPQAAGNLTSASATLSNPRLSFYGAVDVGVSAGATTIDLDTAGTWADENTSHLFPGDTVSVGPNGNLTVGGTMTTTKFFLTQGLTVGASADDTIYATQSGALTITFTITNDIPAGGYVRVLIPDPASGGNDGAPDTAASIAANGFDLNTMDASTDIGTTGGTGCTWGTETLTPGSGSGHQYKVTTTTACTAGAITVTFDGATKDLVNPAPVTSGHTQGTADVYAIDVDTYNGDPDSGGQVIDTIDIKVAPVEAVLVSATVEETLSFAVALRAVGSTSCGKAATVASTATSIPWATLSTTDTFSDTAQQLTVSTNADAGYSVKIEANDQMGKDGVTCTGATAGEANNCIKDTTCDTSCSESSEDDWETATNNGLGFSLENVSGGDTAFQYNAVSGGCAGTAETDFCARQIADMEATETKANILSETAPVSGASAYVCYRITVSATQPEGYYYNKVKYTCTAVF